nr:hypothetical protein [Pseudopedobacter sp.]
MGNIFNDDFREFIELLNLHQVEYILVGGYSVILHGYPRSTGDMDIWVNKSNENFNKLKSAFSDFKMPIMKLEDFLNSENEVFSYGRPPVGIDILTHCKGLEFQDSIKESSFVDVEGLKVNLISYSHLIKAKKAAGRYKDLNDLDHL